MKAGKRQLGPCSLKLGHCQIAPPHLRGGLLEISQLHTDEHSRGKGYATRLMDEVCEEASEARKVLVLVADTLALSTFYSKFGFRLLQESPMIMSREP